MTDHRVVAAFPDTRTAREAIEALERRGVEGANISLAGPGASEFHSQPEMREADRRATAHVWRRIVVGAVVGGALTAVLGLAVDATGLVVGGLALVGATLGAVIGGVAALGMSPAWERTFQPENPRPVTVTVASENAALVERAAALLKERGATSLRSV